MSQYGRPSSDITTTGWSTTPLWDNLDEVSFDDATTEITTGNNPSNVTGEVKLSAVTDPGVNTGHVVRIRAYTTNNCTLACGLYQGTTLIADLGTLTLAAAYSTHTISVTEANAANITDYSDLRVRFTGNGSGRARVTWIELEVPNVIEQKSGSATISGPTHVLATILKTAVIAAAIGILGLVAATGIKSHHIAISGGGAQTVVGKKGVGAGAFAETFESYTLNQMVPDPPFTNFYGGENAPHVYSDAAGKGIGVEMNFDTRSNMARDQRVPDGATDYTVRFWPRNNGGVNAAAGFAFRWTTTGYMFRMWRSAPGWEITRGGTTVASGSDTWATGDVIEIVVRGNTVTVKKNGNVFGSYTDALNLYPAGTICPTVWGTLSANNVIMAGYEVQFPFGSGSPQVSGRGTATVVGAKSVGGSATISGSGNIFIWSEDHYGSLSISGNGAAASSGSKGGKSTATVSSMQVDDFNRADGDIGADYGTQGRSSYYTAQIVSGEVGTNPAMGQAVAIRLGSFGADTSAQFTLKPTVEIGSHQLALWVRALNSQPSNGYMFLLTGGQRQIVRYHNGTGLVVGSFGSDIYQAGDTFTIVPSGSGPVSFKLYKNGGYVGEVIDSTGPYKTSGNPGFWLFGDEYSLRIDDFAWGMFSQTQGITISGGGAVSSAGNKGTTRAAIVSGGWYESAVMGTKNARSGISVSGGGYVAADAHENAKRAVVVSGGGTTAAAGTQGGRAGASVSGNGDVAAAGRAEATKDIWIVGGGAAVVIGDSAYVDTASVSVVISGGGTLSGVASAVKRGEADVYGGGQVKVYYDRAYPYLPQGVIANDDNTCHLITIEMDYCSRTFGVSPCLATGTPCYNTWKTCRYIQGYLAAKKTYRYVSAEFPQALPATRPYVDSVKILATEIKTNLTVNSRLTITMLDEPDADVETDPYWSTRSSHPGTYWKRWLARNPNYKGRIIRVYEGVYGKAESTYQQRWVGKLENIKIKGDRFTFEAVDLLKDLTKIDIPGKTNAKLNGDLSAVSTQSFVVTEDASKFPPSGYVRIDDEILGYTSVNTTTQVFTIGQGNRGLFGTTAVEHSSKAKVQVVKYYAPKNPVEILLDMLLGDAGMKASWVTTGNVNNVNTALTATATYIDLGVAVSQSWPTVGILRLENVGTGEVEFVRYTSKTYIPAGAGTSAAWRFNFEFYGSTMTGRGLFVTTPISGGVNSVRAERGYFDQVDTDTFYMYRDWPSRDINFTSVISEITKLSDLFFEIVDLIDAKVWIAENLTVTIRKNIINTPTTGYVSWSDADNIEIDSGSVDVNEKSRISRYSIFWDKIATGEAKKELSYRRLDLAIDPDAEANYGDHEEKSILCRWIDPYVTVEEVVQTFVKNLAIRRIQRCKHAQHLVVVGVAAKDAAVETGHYIRLSTDELLESDGSDISSRMYQVVKRERKKGALSIDYTLIQITTRRLGIIAPVGLPTYGSATEAQRAYGYISNSSGKMSNGDDGYFIW